MLRSHQICTEIWQYFDEISQDLDWVLRRYGWKSHEIWLEAAMQEMQEEGPVHVAITEGSAELQCKTLENLTLQISTTAGSAVRDVGGPTSAAHHH